MLEQSWVFPWFDTRQEARLPGAHADVARVSQAVMEMLEAGNAYRAGYGAVLRAPRDIPPAEATVPPCLISAYDGDPLQAHIDRLGAMPAGWKAKKVATRAEHEAASLAFLREHGGDAPCPPLVEDSEEGWVVIEGGLIHWRGTRGADRLVLHAPAGEMAAPDARTLAIDAPGHGHSDDFDQPRAAVEAAALALGAEAILWPAPPPGDAETLYPDMTPDRFGAYLQRAWQIARAEAYFAPWYAAGAGHAVPLEPAALDPEALQRRARARIVAGGAARRWHDTLSTIKGDN